jgi:hypothetical protein
MPTLRSAPSWRYPGGPGCFVIALVDAPPPGFAAEAFGGELQPLHDGALVIKVSAGDGESAIARADRCAQALHVLAPRAPIAVAATPEALAVAAKELLAAHLAMQFGRDVPTIRILT